MRKHDLWRYPTLRGQAVMPFLLALAPYIPRAARLDLRAFPVEGGRFAVLLPRPSGSAPEDELVLLRSNLAEAYDRVNRPITAGEQTPLVSLDITSLPNLMEGVLAVLFDLAVPVSNDGADASPEHLRAVIENGRQDIWAQMFASIVRRSRDVRFLVSDTRATLLDLDGSDERGATLAGLRAAGLPEGVTLLRPHPVAGFSLWLPEQLQLDDNARGDAATILNALAEAKLLAAGGDLHLLRASDGSGQALWLAAEHEESAFAPLETLATAVTEADVASDLGPALGLTLHRLRPDAEAQAELTARLNARDFPIGYRIRLSRLPEIQRSENDIERLREEIEEREARIALIQALGRHQLRLLRFTDAQLPVLVEGLRQIPPSLRQSASLLYAATHAAGRAEPAHFILYDPDQVEIDTVQPEHYWRARRDDRPISFWLDPHAEEARDGSDLEPLVFVPTGHRILPCIDSFGGTLTGTLRIVLGNLFADASAVLDASGSRPAFVFSDLRDETGSHADEIAVELIDLAAFRPLRASLRWINDHILARSPRVADPEDLRELAEWLYKGQLAQDLRARMRSEVKELKISWQQAEDELLDDLDQLALRAEDEVRAFEDSLVTARQFVATAAARLGELTSGLNTLGAAMDAADHALAEIAGDIPELTASRLAFLDRFQVEYELGLDAIASSQKSVADMKTRVAALLAELEH